MSKNVPASLSNWNLIRSFLALSYFLEYTAAAQELGVSVPTLRRRIDRLESFLNCRLFIYERRVLQLTPDGQQAIEIATQADRIMGEVRELQGSRQTAARPCLNLSMDENVLHYFWVPFAARNAARLSAYQTKIDVDQIPDFSSVSEIDCAISFDEPPLLAGVNEPVGSFGIYLAAHQRYVERWGEPTVETLNQHTFLRPTSEVFTALGSWLLADLERLCGQTLQVTSPKQADTATRLGMGFFFGTPWLEREGYVLFEGFPVLRTSAFVSFSTSFVEETANADLMQTIVEEAKVFFRDRDPPLPSINTVEDSFPLRETREKPLNWRIRTNKVRPETDRA